ncbi:DNA primase [Nocardia sp. ET3-3]|uniref:DNA primase n=1 Tax=Nocardia terrae TaxID=2675851 RepID=A0A7K1V267_9NOCA|nr:bifunctional DNA primase/polymerase [Nocardia terrae]MVU80631.1 DNA primase [Nocardia terrae]
MPTNRFRAAAHAAAARGWFVFPLRPGSKRPALREWPREATTDPERIRRWWNTNPHYNIGIATGPSQLHVIDLDTHHGIDGPAVLRHLAITTAQQTSLLTYTVATPSGTGRHLYYGAPQGLRLPNTTARLGPGIDTRGHGGYVVAVGSHTIDGDYRVLANKPVADLPEWLQALLTPPPTPPGNPGAPPQHPDAYLQAILTAETSKVRTATPGTRNTTLFRAALTLGRLIAGQTLDPHLARDALTTAAAIHIGHHEFTARELERTITSGFTIGARHPRHLTTRR